MKIIESLQLIGGCYTMNLDQWTFYLVPTKVLEEKLKDQKKLSLSTLLHLRLQSVDFENLQEQFAKAIGRERR